MAVELFTVIILVSVFEQTSSTLMAAGVMVARALPPFILGPVAGVLVDRFPRKKMLVWMGLVQFLIATLAIWYVSGAEEISVVVIYFLLISISAADSFHRPACLSLIPSLVAPGRLFKANSLILLTDQIMMAISYTAGGWLILSLPLYQVIFGVAALFIMATITAVPIAESKRKDKHTGKKDSVWKSWLAGWNYLCRHSVARPLTIMETMEHLPHGIWTGALMLAFTTMALHGDAVDWGYQASAYFTGMILGSLAALAGNNWLSRYPGYIIVVNACLSGLLTLAYASSRLYGWL